MMVFLPIVLGLLLVSKLSAGDFSYDGSHGPSHWGEDYRTCLGKYQSPIDIEERDVTRITFPPLQFSGLRNRHSSFITNNGHTVMLETEDPETVTISGGPTNDTYIFTQLHFHWGEDDRVGSEDLINNHSYSMELHAVFYKKSYKTSAEAMNHPDGLTVLGYLFEAVDDPNPIFDPIVTLLPNLTAVNAKSTVNDPMILSKLIAPNPSSTQDYYTYKGSLTTPPCLEIVTWIDFTQSHTLSHDQLAAFRNVHASDGQNLTHNFRPVQPLDGRVVYRNIPGQNLPNPKNIPPHKSGQEGTTVSILSHILAFLAGAVFVKPYN